MFKVILILAFISFVAAVPVRRHDDEDSTDVPEVIAIIKSESVQKDDGSYSFNYESEDGNFREENAEVLNKGTPEETIRITGSYKYTDAYGQTVLVTYTADENGFVPVGTIIAKEISDAALAAKDLPKLEEKTEKTEEPVRFAKQLPVVEEKYEEEEDKSEEVESETEPSNE